jgi:hypothetical protein
MGQTHVHKYVPALHADISRIELSAVIITHRMPLSEAPRGMRCSKRSSRIAARWC